MTDLLERLRSATGPDRELDGRIMFGLFAKPCGDRGFLWPEDSPDWVFAHLFDHSTRGARAQSGETIEWQRDDGKWVLVNSLRVPPVTASLDAALALVERALPRRGPIVICITGNAQVSIDSDNPCGPSVQVIGATPALALLIALLTAKEAQ